LHVNTSTSSTTTTTSADYVTPSPILNLNLDKNPQIIDLKKDTKRKEIGFETESILDNEWKEVKVDGSKLLFNYSKLSKKNLTGINEKINIFCKMKF
jgi:hypothetical protein